MVRWLLLAHGLALATGLQVTEPADLAGEYGDSPADFAPANYDVNALGVVATSCPCEWATESSPILKGSLSDRILIVNDDVCNNSCTAMVAACAAQLANASGVLVTNRYDPSVLFFDGKHREAAPEGEFAATNARLNASCQDPIPTAYVTSNTTDLLAAAMLNITVTEWRQVPASLQVEVHRGAFILKTMETRSLIEVNLTMSHVTALELGFSCDKYMYMPLVYLLLVPVWWLLTVLWTWNTYRAHAASARDLHRLLCWVPTMQFVHGILSLFNYSSCPWDTTRSLVYATFWAVVTILKEPVVLLCLLLVSKGWCITRNTLQRREVCLAGCNLALLYAAVSIQLSVQSVVSMVPMVAMYLAMLADVTLSIFANLRILKAQLMALRSFGIDPRTTPAHRKYQMFVRLALFTFLYVLLEMVIHLSFTGRSDESFALFVLLHQLMELFIAVGIGYTFRAQPFNVHFQQIQQVASELADQLLPSITTVEIAPDLLNGADLIAWRADLRLGADGDTHMPTTLVVLNPGDKEMSPDVTAPSRRIPAAVGAPPGPPPAAPPPPRGAGSRMLASLASEPRSGPRFPPSFAARFGSSTRPTQPPPLPSTSTSADTPPGVEMGESPAVEMSESPGRGDDSDLDAALAASLAGTSGEEAGVLGVSALADFSRESSEILESYNEPLAADAAVDELAGRDGSEFSQADTRVRSEGDTSAVSERSEAQG